MGDKDANAFFGQPGEPLSELQLSEGRAICRVIHVAPQNNEVYVSLESEFDQILKRFGRIPRLSKVKVRGVQKTDGAAIGISKGPKVGDPCDCGVGGCGVCDCGVKSHGSASMADPCDSGRENC